MPRFSLLLEGTQRGEWDSSDYVVRVCRLFGPGAATVVSVRQCVCVCVGVVVSEFNCCTSTYKSLRGDSFCVYDTVS